MALQAGAAGKDSEHLPVPKMFVVVVRGGVVALVGALQCTVEVAAPREDFGNHFGHVVRNRDLVAFQALDDLLGLLIALPLEQHLQEEAVEVGVAVAIHRSLQIMLQCLVVLAFRARQISPISTSDRDQLSRRRWASSA